VSVRRARLVVRGRVQGVGYRWFARDAATALGLQGWVRNRRDGSVELETAGTEATLSALCERLRQGPPAAQVTAVDVQWLPEAAGEADPSPGPGFEIRPSA